MGNVSMVTNKFELSYAMKNYYLNKSNLLKLFNRSKLYLNFIDFDQLNSVINNQQISNDIRNNQILELFNNSSKLFKSSNSLI